MSATKYTYLIQTDFPNHVENSDSLKAEIAVSSITIALDYINTVLGHPDPADDYCDIWFKAALSEGEETALDGVVAAHQGVAPRHNAETEDGRSVVRQTIVNKAVAFRPRAITCYTADPSKLHNYDPAGVDYEDVTVKCYKANGDEITQAPYTDAVKTVLDFEPHYYYEMIGGGIDIPTTITGGTTDLWYGVCIGVPDIPAEYGGSIDLMNELNIEADRDGILRLDGRGVLGLEYSATLHTNKIRFIFKHPAGESKRLLLMLEIFR